jgi:hypothetical protein
MSPVEPGCTLTLLPQNWPEVVDERSRSEDGPVFPLAAAGAAARGSYWCEIMSSAPGFVRISQAWYGSSELEGCIERVCISSKAGSPKAARRGLVLEWRAIGNRPELRVEQDAWAMLAQDFSGLQRHLARHHDGGPLSADDLCDLLLRLGFSDMTERIKPPNVERLPQRFR